MSGLQVPPASLVGFPERPPAQQPAELYRIFFHRSARSGALNSPWRYSSRPADDNRFDLPAPAGTCYWSDRRYGAWVEVFRGVTLLDPVDATRRRLFTAAPPAMRLADLTAPAAHAFGVTAEISTAPSYALPQQWADALHQHGVQGLIGTCRHDPTSAARTVAVFGRAGTAVRRAGWTTTRGRIERDATLLSELATLGVHLASVPHTVTTIPPPQPPP